MAHVPGHFRHRQHGAMRHVADHVRLAFGEQVARMRERRPSAPTSARALDRAAIGQGAHAIAEVFEPVTVVEGVSSMLGIAPQASSSTRCRSTRWMTT